MKPSHEAGGSVHSYIVVALVLAVITYMEFALVEYDFNFLSPQAVIFWLVLLSVIKFALVVLFFMHLRYDSRILSGLFGSGLVIGVGMVLALSLIFAAFQGLSLAQESAGGEAEAAAEELIAERSLLERFLYPAPKDFGLDVSPTLPPPEIVGIKGELNLALTLPAEEAVGSEAAPPSEISAVAAFDWQELGASTYGNCAACHQPTGQGIPAAFPPLAQNLPLLYNAEGGRAYLISVLLYGLQGQIDVLGQSYSSVMPAWQQLSDEQIAAVLNHSLTSWGNDDLLADFNAIEPAEVAALRGQDLGPQQVLELRQQLVLE